MKAISLKASGAVGTGREEHIEKKKQPEITAALNEMNEFNIDQ